MLTRCQHHSNATRFLFILSLSLDLYIGSTQLVQYTHASQAQTASMLLIKYTCIFDMHRLTDQGTSSRIGQQLTVKLAQPRARHA